MKFTRLTLVLLLCASASLARGDRASLRVDFAGPRTNVSPMLYGIFFEEINHAGDGGLYAEMVRHRSFDDDATAGGWSPEGGAEIALDSTQPQNQESLHSIRIEVPDVGGVASNAGYWGVAVESAKSYDLSLYARASAGHSGDLT